MLLEGSDALLTSLGNLTQWTDTSAQASTTYTYAVRTRDGSGNTSPLTPAPPVTTGAGAPPIFADGFERHDFSAWSATSGLALESTNVRSGTWAAEGTTSTSAAYAKATLATSDPEVYARTGFEVNGQASQVTLLRVRDTANGSGAYVYLTAAGKLAVRNDNDTAGVVSSVTPGAGWHTVELHVKSAGAGVAGGVIDVWLDGNVVTDLSSSNETLGVASFGALQIGDTAAGTWDIVFDDVALGTSRLGVSAGGRGGPE